jgi:anti-sigma factor RsiW
MSCKEFVELVTDYLEGRMTPAELERSAKHLEACDGCSTYVEQMRETVGALRGLIPGEVSAETRDRILAAFRERTA